LIIECQNPKEEKDSRPLKVKIKILPTLMVTTSPEDADGEEAMKLGAQRYLLKDMEPDELITSLKSNRNGENVVATT